MDDMEAEHALLVLGDLLVWKDGPFTFVPDIRATFQDGRYTIHQETSRNHKQNKDGNPAAEPEAAQERICEYLSASTRRGKKPLWWYRPTDLALAKRACAWHAIIGDWPKPEDRGWEFLSQS